MKITPHSQTPPHPKTGLVTTLSLIRRSRACLPTFWLISLLALADTSQATVTITGTLEATDSTQTGRITRDGTPSVAATPKPFPGMNTTSGSRLYDSYTFTNSTGGTATYTFTILVPDTSLFSVSYLGTFNPADPSQNYLADMGSSGTGTYSFQVINGDSFVVVVHEVNPGSGLNKSYSFTLPESRSGPPPEELSAMETGLPMANALGQMLISGNQTATSDVNNHIFGLMAGDGEEAANSSLSASLDEGVVIGQGDGPEDPIARKVLRSRQWELYTTVNYGYLDLNALGSQAGVNVESWAPGIGIERHLSRGLALGFAVSFLQSWQDYSGGLGSLDLEGPALSTYLTFVRKNYWSSLLYSFGSYELDSTRNPGLGFPQAYGSTHSYTNSVQYNTGWNFRFQNNTLLTGPFAGIDYLHGTVDAYSETGGGAAALRYAEQSYESLVTRVGWSASKKIKTDFASITPQVRLSYERQNLENNGTSVALINAPFTAAGGNQSPGQDYLAAGAGVNLAFNDQLSVLLSYQGQFFRSDMSAHMGALRLSYKF